MLHFPKCLIVCGLLALVLSGCGKNAETPVVCVAGPVELYEAPKLEKKKGELPIGTKLTILSSQDNAVQVKSESGQEGWIGIYEICTSTELERRKSQNQIPKNLVLIGSGDRGFYFYGGSISIGEGSATIRPGDAFWMDPTAKGKTFTFGNEMIPGDPSVILLKPEKGNIQRLPIWKLSDK